MCQSPEISLGMWKRLQSMSDIKIIFYIILVGIFIFIFICIFPFPFIDLRPRQRTEIFLKVKRSCFTCISRASETIFPFVFRQWRVSQDPSSLTTRTAVSTISHGSLLATSQVFGPYPIALHVSPIPCLHPRC